MLVLQQASWIVILFFSNLQVEEMNSLFVNNRDSPPVYKNQPPIAGSIYWEKSLFLRIKHTVIRFQNLEEMTQSNQGKLVSFF